MYLQTVDAAYALRDAMRQFAGTDIAYPSATLVFAPAIPPGSSVGGGDFKARIVGLDALDGLLQQTGAKYWSFEKWRTFAHHHRLTPVDKLQAAFDPQLHAAEQLLASYGAAVRRTYTPLAAGMIPFDCRENDDSPSSDEIIERGASGADLLLRGPSGCGKTLLAYRIALECAERGRVPVFISAKDFEISSERAGGASHR